MTTTEMLINSNMNLMSVFKQYADFIDTEISKELDIEYIDFDGTIKSVKVKNMASLLNFIKQYGITLNDDGILVDLDGNFVTTNKSLDTDKMNGMTLDELTDYIKEKVNEKDSNIIDFKLIENGTPIRYSTDDIDTAASDLGYELFCPHNREEYEEARQYLISIGKPTSMGPLGIYYDGVLPRGGWSVRGWMSNIPLNSNNLGTKGWKVKDGSLTWWASDLTTVTEPNGDYTKNAYLGITYDANGYVKWYNDANDRYVYRTYLCVKRRKA